jgi:hypothetical protein
MKQILLSPNNVQADAGIFGEIDGFKRLKATVLKDC